MTRLPVVVVGAGHCGLAMSRHLAARSIDHVVLERGEVANSWRTERWDSLRLLTPNWLSRLPGHAYDGVDPDGYMTAGEVAGFIQGYADTSEAPVRTNTTVESVAAAAGGGYRVRTDDGEWTADAVVVASGACNLAKVPAVAESLPARITSMSTLEYRNPEQVPEGGVLVVGAAASGIQIADELISAGRRVTVSTGEHVRMPRRYRGADVMWWMESAGVLDQRYDEVDDIVRARHVASMQLTGSDDGRTLDLNRLVSRGARLVGRLEAVHGGRVLMFAGSLPNVCALADLKLRRLLEGFDAWAEEAGVEVPEPPERYEATRVPSPPEIEIDLAGGEIGTIIWATGYKPDFSWLEVPVLNARGWLVHDGGLTTFPGLYLLGMPFLRRRKSTLIDGARADTADLFPHLVEHLDAVAANGAAPRRFVRDAGEPATL